MNMFYHVNPNKHYGLLKCTPLSHLCIDLPNYKLVVLRMRHFIQLSTTVLILVNALGLLHFTKRGVNLEAKV